MYLGFCRAGACCTAIAFLTFAPLGGGENFPGKGYVHEVVTESLKRAGYSAEIHFY